MADAKEKVAEKAADTKPKVKDHIRFVGHRSDGENSVCTVFGKNFRRGVWVPLTNLDGTNPDKKALKPEELTKLLGNPAFELGDGKDDAPLAIAGAEEDKNEDA